MKPQEQMSLGPSPRPEAPVSVVIPCYNCSTTLERAVTSVLAQTILPGEIILVDDGSTDNTPDVIHELESRHPDCISSIRFQNNRGPSSARNAGWDHATQPYVAFLDADDAWLPRKIEIQWEWMSNHPQVHLSGHALASENFHAELPHVIDWHEVRPRQLLIRNEFSPCGMMLQRNIPLRFPEDQRFMEDQWFTFKAAFSGLRLYASDQPLAIVYKDRYGVAGLSGNLWLMERSELQNLHRLRKEGHISLPLYIGVTCWSLLKFARRFIQVSWRKTVGGRTR